MCAFRPLLDTVTVLLVVLPLPDVGCTVCVGVGPFSIAFVIQPLTLINVAISVIESALAACVVKIPLAIILGTVGPLHNTVTVSQTPFPLAFENRASFVSVHAIDHFV